MESALAPARRTILDGVGLALLALPAAHPLFIPVVGAPSHLLWWVHVLPVALLAYGYGRAGAAVALPASALLLIVGERLFGLGYGIPAPWQAVAILAVALTATNVLVGGFAIYARRAARRLSGHAYEDPLTGLPNRRRLWLELRDRLAAGQQEGEIAVLFIDIDDFKTVNDSLGHTAGDEVLRAVAERLRACLRPVDFLGRWAGDEFVALLAGGRQPDTAVAVAHRIREALELPVTLSGTSILLHVGIGIAVQGADTDPESLLRDADTALHDAKAGGRSRHVVFDDRMRAAVCRRLDLVTDIQRALGRGEFLNHYQPIHDAQSGAIRGVEALVRWDHPRYGIMTPGEFIPLAESSGLIVDLGREVLERALRDTQGWLESGRVPKDLFVSVNVSAAQVHVQGFADDVMRLCRRHDLDPGRLMIEITETLFMDRTEEQAAALGALRDAGVRLAIDDFGSGYSSLGYLHRLPVQTLKIDRELVEQLDGGEASLVRPIVEIARALDLEVIAEGVETERQLQELAYYGSEMVQGFFLSRPMPAARLLEELIADADGRSRSATVIPWPGRSAESRVSGRDRLPRAGAERKLS